MRFLLVLLVSLPLFALAQTQQRSRNDSVSYYQRELRNMHVQALDSLRQSESYRLAMEGLLRNKVLSGNYSSFTIFSEIASADFSSLNHNISQDGFPSISGPVTRFGIGFSSKSNRFMFDLMLFTFGVNKKSKKDGETVSATFNNMFQYDMGYDLVASRILNIYPYAGLSFRIAELSYKKDVPFTGNPSRIIDLLQYNKYTSASTFKIGYQAGIGMDVVLSKSTRPGGVIVFAKAGTNGPIGKERYEIEGEKFNPGIKYGNFISAFGFKFFSRQ